MPRHAAIFIDNTVSTALNGHKIVNCSFEDIIGTFGVPGSIGVWDSNQKFNVTNCFFRNISSNHSNPRAGAFNCDMNNFNNFGYYNVSGNTFIDIHTNKSAARFNGTFLSLEFSYNSFYNVSSTNQSGVDLFIH
jgi:hypothetical protein